MPPERESTLDAEALAGELRGRIRGEVRFDDGSRALYATDSSNYRQVPIGVVVPADIPDVVETVSICRERGAPVLSRGGGTSLAGQCCNVAVVMDFSKYVNRVLSVDPEARTARVEPGTILDDLRREAEPHGLTFGPDPATHDHCTLGGMIGNDSCGVHSVMAAFEGEGPRTADNVDELEILTYDGLRMRVGRTSEEEVEQIVAEGGRRGEIYSRLRALAGRYGDEIRRRYPDIPRRVSGYNLPYLLPEKGFHVARALVGSEGTCVTVLGATVRLIPNPAARSLVVLGFVDVFAAADHVPQVMGHRPIGLEGLDEGLVDDMKKSGLHPDGVRLLPEGRGWLLVEFGGESKEESDEKARRLIADLAKGRGRSPSSRLFDDPADEKRMWAVRESGLGATAHPKGSAITWEGWEDSAAPPEKLGGYLRDLRKLMTEHGYRGDFYGHFGQGCVHTRNNFDLETREGIGRFRSYVEAAADLVVRYGGSLSGEHGDGQSRAELLPKMFGPDLVAAFREFKAIWDPGNRMNPGKVVDPYRLDENLRLGADFRPWRPETHFQFPHDGGDFPKAVLRCVGVGKCRRLDGGTMCPSFMVTREEEHSTRGRARLLFEMLRRGPLDAGWREESVKEALDLCLACKGCKSDCPVDVDMATYKAEFLSHYWAGRLRPRAAYAFGLVFWWARIASLWPGAANFLTQTAGLEGLAKLLAGVARERRIPRIAPRTFRRWFARRRETGERRGGDRVLLWPDTFNDHFHPSVAIAAVEALESAGFRVALPPTRLCCGRPLYDYGMLSLARRMLRRILRVLRDEIRAGTPLVVLEPSCAAVFCDELPNLFPHDEDAERLRRQTFVLAGFLEKYRPDLRVPQLTKRALVQGHCHHGAVFGMADERSVLEKIGLDFEILESGCCGMAGSFGFEGGRRYEVSMKCAERVLLPRVRESGEDTLLLADGFSCREQILQGSGREALHLSQVLRMAYREGERS